MGLFTLCDDPWEETSRRWCQNAGTNYTENLTLTFVFNSYRSSQYNIILQDSTRLKALLRNVDVIVQVHFVTEHWRQAFWEVHFASGASFFASIEMILYNQTLTSNLGTKCTWILTPRFKEAYFLWKNVFINRTNRALLCGHTWQLDRYCIKKNNQKQLFVKEKPFPHIPS